MTEEYLEAMTNKYWDAKTLRVLLPKNEIESLPIKVASDEEINERMRSIYWNGWEYYPIGTLLKDEAGYDGHYRYIRAVAS